MTEERKKATTLSLDWPGKALPVMPGDFSKYAPPGRGLDVPLNESPFDYYDYRFEPREADPIRGAPRSTPSGGVIYFDHRDAWDKVEAALALMGVILKNPDFVVFGRESREPIRDRYLDQVRIMSKFALGQVFRLYNEAAAIATQPVTVGELIAQFLVDQEAKWYATNENTGSRRITGVFGGDTDWADERLGFGFMVENGPYDIYRLWSRAWFLTK